MRTWTLLALLFAAASAFARTVSTGTYVCNPGTVVSVPLSVDDLSDVAVASFTVNYDATAVACLGVDAGAAVDAGRFTYADTGAGQIVLLASGFNQTSGVVARLRLYARAGTQGLYSDVTIAEADLAARNGLTNLAAANPVATENGMVRIVGASAETARLERPQFVWPKTELKSLSLTSGDGVVASDDRRPVRVSGAVSAAGAIPVAAPPNGWQTGSYALLSTPTAGLSFELRGVANGAVRAVVADGVTTYYADVTVAGSVGVAAADGELPEETLAQIRTALADELAAHPDVTSVSVKGDPTVVPVAVDLGIAPVFDVLGTTATATYVKPTLTITAFDPKTGLVRIKVTPGAGNAIRTALATGCIHVYGTSDLSEKMRFVGQTTIDLTPYLKAETKGEADLTVALGTHTFIKVKAETIIKQEGDEE